MPDWRIGARGKPSAQRIPLATIEQVLGLYKDRYYDLNIRHFQEKLRDEHAIQLSYTWVQKALQGAGLVAKRHKRGPHRRRRPRRPLPGMLLHIDGSKHRWLNDDRWYDLLVILDDATSEIYYAQLVLEESTRTVMRGLREVIETKGLFCALYSDRGSHFFVTVKEGEKADKHRLTQVGRAMKELGVQMIAAYSPQARGRSERSFGTGQGRLPQELRLAGITTVVGTNGFLRERYIGEFNAKFSMPAAEKGTAPLLNSSRRHGTVHPSAGEWGAPPGTGVFQFQAFAFGKSAWYVAIQADWPLRPALRSASPFAPMFPGYVPDRRLQACVKHSPSSASPSASSPAADAVPTPAKRASRAR
jgi:hypothetical protein